MLRTLTFRTKLLCTLVVPMAALLVLTAIAGRDRLDQSDRADRLGRRIGVVSAALDLDHQVQLELAASANKADASTLSAARVATDAAKDRLNTGLGSTTAGTTAYDHAVGRVRTDLRALATTRTGVDGGTPVATYAVAFGELSASLSDLTSTISDEAEDPGLARQTAAIAVLSQVTDATATEWAGIDAAASRGTLASGEAALIRGAVSSRAQWEGVYDGLATGAANDALRSLLIGDAINTTNAIEAAALRVPDGGTFTANAPAWRKAMSARLELLHRAEGNALGTLASSAQRITQTAQSELRTFIIIAGAAILISIVLGLLLVRAVTKPLRKLTAAAQRLANEQLPALVDGLKSPGPEDQRYLKAVVEPIEIRSQDELGKLAAAFNSVQSVAVDVAAEQAELLRKGIGDLFVSLARRNQVLIDRQIEFLDELEAAEDDPDQLGSLYRLDHLATRMRRNAESLLVLAGHEPARRRTKPVALVDVARAAIGETEDYARVELLAFEEVGVSGIGAVDLGHLLAELLENATHFSPPDTKVTVEGRLARNGYVVSIVDQGIGMTADQLADANNMLATPPPVGLALSRSLGFTVVARLAQRHGVTVRLMPAPGSGTAAVVHLPAHLIATSADNEIDVAPPAATAPLPTPVAAPQPDGAPRPAPEPPSSLGPVFERVIDEPWPPAAVEPEPASEPAAAPFSLDDNAFEHAFQRAWGEPAPDERQATTDRDEPEPAGPEPTIEAYEPYEPMPEPEPLIRPEPTIEAYPTMPDPEPEPKPEPDVVLEADSDAHANGDADAEAGTDVDDWGVDDEGWNETAPEPSPMSWAEEEVDVDVDALSRRQPASPPIVPADSLEAALPTGAAFDKGLAALMRGDDALGPASLVEPAIDIPTSPSRRDPDPQPAAADPIPAPPLDPVADFPDPDREASSLTSAGLVRRVPKASPAGPAEEGPGAPAIAANRRSPEDVRAMLAHYRTGLQRGRADGDTEPEDE